MKASTPYKEMEKMDSTLKDLQRRHNAGRYAPHYVEQGRGTSRCRQYFEKRGILSKVDGNHHFLIPLTDGKLISVYYSHWEKFYEIIPLKKSGRLDKRFWEAVRITPQGVFNYVRRKWGDKLKKLELG